MRLNEDLTQAELKEVLHYDPESGIFRWRFAKPNGVKPWNVAGAPNSNLYVKIYIKKKMHSAHRLAWLYMTGAWPPEYIDHVDGDVSNNKWSNLRTASAKQNMENLRLSKRNTSGFRGVIWKKDVKKWRAQVGHRGRALTIGLFATKIEAAEAAAKKRAELFTHDTGRDRAKP